MSTRDGRADEVWRRLFQFFMHSRPQRDKALADAGLTPNDMRTLSALHGTDGRTMRSLADEWSCDPSNVTWVVNRLEKLGLVRRRKSSDDHRVRLVALTPAGSKMLARVVDHMWRSPPELRDLSSADLQTLRSILMKLPAAGKTFGIRAPK
jgi:DNA-binding MarR family transcriptional regulator